METVATALGTGFRPTRPYDTIYHEGAPVPRVATRNYNGKERCADLIDTIGYNERTGGHNQC